MNNEELIKKALGVEGTIEKVSRSQLKVFGSSGTRMIEMNEIKAPKARRRRGDDELSEWTAHDFCHYIRELHGEYLHTDWNLNWLRACVSVCTVRDKLTDLLGFCDNVIFKDYIEFFFENFLDEFMLKRKDFYLSLIHISEPTRPY